MGRGACILSNAQNPLDLLGSGKANVFDDGHWILQDALVRSRARLGPREITNRTAHLARLPSVVVPGRGRDTVEG